MFTTDDNGLQRAANSKNWFSRGRDLLEESRYEDALVCFEEAERLGYPKSAEAILLCKRELGLT
jgi:cytochrome c-type biogenesis protein CcmH/NrfG